MTKKYVFDSNNSPGTIVSFIRDLDYKDPYLKYVNLDISGQKILPMDFPTENILPEGEPVYIRNYLPDSNLAEFYSPSYHHRIWGFTTGYIHRSFIHDTMRGH
jgi:hypothetical protein